jgi:glycosyltransferase involved in cell wall biosynthesis
MAGQLVPYKRPELAVEAFNRMRKPLVVIGGGSMLHRIREIAGPTVTVMGPQQFAVLRHYYSRCRALVFPGEEDFGIVPVEAMASGRPVIAYGRGGATESVVPNATGLFFFEQNVEAIVAAVTASGEIEFEPENIAAHARRFGISRFKTEISDLVARLYDDRERGTFRPLMPVSLAAQ